MAEELPALTLLVAAEKARELQQREETFSSSVRGFYAELFPEFRNEVRSIMLENFPVEPGKKLPNWDLLKARQRDLQREVAKSFSELLDVLTSEVATIFDDELVSGYEEGYNRGLWELYQGGVDVEPDDLGSADDVAVILAASGFGGVGYRQRLKNWGSFFKSKFNRWIRVAVAMEQDLEQTLEGVDQITNAVRHRGETLAVSELHRAFNQGSRRAYEDHVDSIAGEVWLTREDPVVCSVCKGKHLTITDDQPIDDSHPACRCWKAPIFLDYQGRPIDYVGFLQSIGKR